MPPKKRAAPAEEYSSDGGFVANDDEDERPRSKKVKTESAAKGAGRKITEASGKGVGGGGVSEGEEVFWEVSFLYLRGTVGWEDEEGQCRKVVEGWDMEA